MKLPLLISIPHAGVRVPPEVKELCLLTPEQIAADSDEGAATIYALQSDVTACLSADVARAVVDLNRAENDRRPDGVVKTHTCQKVPVYCRPLTEDLVETLISRYYRPYHKRLTALAQEARLGIDCHTMAEFGPPIGPDPGCERPHVCLSHAEGTCPDKWFIQCITCFESTFGDKVSVNTPFTGGHIIRSHASELPWVQIELSRGAFLSDEQKHERVLRALKAFCDSTF